MTFQDLLNDFIRPLIGEANDRADAAKVVASRPYSTQGALDALHYARGVQEGIGHCIEVIEQVIDQLLQPEISPMEPHDLAVRAVEQNPGQKLSAIRQYREDMVIYNNVRPGLLEAKDVIERVLRPDAVPPQGSQ